MRGIRAQDHSDDQITNVKKQSEREIKWTKRSIATEDPALRGVPGLWMKVYQNGWEHQKHG
jgi:hypothetical protein